MPHFLNLDLAVAQIFERCGERLIIAAPLGLGKPNALLNALYRAVASTPTREMNLYTALSLARPPLKAGLEGRFLQPFLERQFGRDYPDLDYVLDRRAGRMPSNVRVHEFYLQSGSALGNRCAQSQYSSISYTHVARDVAARAPNLIVQMVAMRGERLSLSCNPDVTLDLLERMRANGQPRPYVVAVVHPDLPFLGNDAEVPLDFADLIVAQPGPAHRLFALPREPVQLTEHALGIHAATLVRDGGTLQIGIGALSDALVHALLMRQTKNSHFVAAAQALGAQAPGRTPELAPLKVGLYGASEMVMDGFMHLRQAGILRRRVYADIGLQRLLNQGKIFETADASTLERLIEQGLLPLKIDGAGLQWLTRVGLLAEGARVRDGQIYWPDMQVTSADLSDFGVRSAFGARLVGRSLSGGHYLNGAFWLGSQVLIDWLGGLQGADYEGLGMTRVSHVNELYGGREALEIEQRHEARFFNTCMMQTVLGAAVSDGLADGQVVSGVGGQYNFVAMAHALPNGRSILMLRATRDSASGVVSNIVWSYPHVTIPRFLRDIVVTEYGIADLRGASDEECIDRMLSICDARFIDALAAQAIRAGKLAADYQIPSRYRENSPAQLAEKLRALAALELFPVWPFGSDFNALELETLGVLKRLKALTATRLGRALTIAKAFTSRATAPNQAAVLQRLDLSKPKNLEERVLARLVAYACAKAPGP